MCRSISMDRSVWLWLRFPQVYELVRLVVYGGLLRHPLRALTYDLSLSLRYGEAKRRAHDHDHPHHLPELLCQIPGDSGIIIVQHASQQSQKGWLSVGCSPSDSRPCYPSEVHQSVHEAFVWLETRVGHVYKRRKKYVEEEGCEHPPLVNALFHSEPTASDTFCITYIYCVVVVCCCCLHIESRSDLYSVLSNIGTGPTDANAFRGHRLTTQKGYTYQKGIKGPRKVNTHAIIGK